MKKHGRFIGQIVANGNVKVELVDRKNGRRGFSRPQGLINEEVSLSRLLSKGTYYLRVRSDIGIADYEDLVALSNALPFHVLFTAGPLHVMKLGGVFSVVTALVKGRQFARRPHVLIGHLIPGGPPTVPGGGGAVIDHHDAPGYAVSLA